jgi:flagellar motor switch protein FliN
MSDDDAIVGDDPLETIDAPVEAPAGAAEAGTVVDVPEAPAAAPEIFADLGAPSEGGVSGPSDLAPVLDVPVDLIVEIGRTRMTIRETLAIGRGSVIALNKLAGEPADLLVNGRLIARGEVVAIDEEFGLRVTEVVPPEKRLDAGLA